MNISPTFDLNFFMKFCGINLLIIEIISTNFREKTHPLRPETRYYWTKVDRSNGKEPR